MPFFVSIGGNAIDRLIMRVMSVRVVRRRRHRRSWKMKIVIPGGTGQIGQILARHFGAAGHEVVILSRQRDARHGRVVPWDGRSRGRWFDEIDGSDVVINLAGRSVNCRYSALNRREIMESRVLSSRLIGEAIARSGRPPRVWLQASTATIYAHTLGQANDELTGVIGGQEADTPGTWRFSIEVARAWEAACNSADTPRTRRVLMRSAMTMSPDAGGIFDTMLRLVRRGLGGTAGSGRQFVSWIHDADLVRAIEWLMEHEEISGAVNLCSPHPLPNVEFMRTLRRAWGCPIGLPASRLMLGIGAILMGTETELVLKSRRVVPTLLLKSGFQFRYSSWEAACQEICGRIRNAGCAKNATSGWVIS